MVLNDGILRIQKSERTKVNARGIVGSAEADILPERLGVFEIWTGPT